MAQPLPVSREKVSFEEFLQIDVEGKIEWVDGEVLYLGTVTAEHDQLRSFLHSLLTAYVEEKGLGQVFGETFVMRLPGARTGRCPDIHFVSAERLSIVGKTHLEGPSDLVVEIVSRESRKRDRGEKFAEYEAAGIPEYWLIDPERKLAQFYAVDEEGRYRSFHPDDENRLHSRTIEGLWIDVAWLWERPRLIAVLRLWGLA